MAKKAIQTVLKIGNSLGVILPVDVCRGLGIARGDQVSFAVFEENTVMVRKLTAEELQSLKPKYIDINS